MTVKKTLRINNLQVDKEANKKYRDAIYVLEELHIFDLLREQLLESFTTSNVGFEYGKDIDLYNYHHLCGYIDCLEDIRSLSSSETTIAKPVVDFGAREELEKQGYSKEEINKMFGE